MLRNCLSCPLCSRPARGSIRWCASPSALCQRRTVVLDVARPPPRRMIHCPAAVLEGRPFLLDLSMRTGTRTLVNRYLLTAAAGFGALLTLPPARVTTRLETAGLPSAGSLSGARRS